MGGAESQLMCLHVSNEFAISKTGRRHCRFKTTLLCFFHIIFVFGTYSAKDRQPHCVFNVIFYLLVFETRRLSRTLKSFGLLFKCQGRGLLSRKTSCVGCSTLIQCLSTSLIRGGLSRTLCWVIIGLKANKHQWNISFLYKQSVLNVCKLENCTMIHAISKQRKNSWQDR